MSSKQKYTLFKNEGDGPKPCAFFSSAQGCRSGASCPFVHGTVVASTSTQSHVTQRPKPVTSYPPETIKRVVAPAPDVVVEVKKKRKSIDEAEMQGQTPPMTTHIPSRAKASPTYIAPTVATTVQPVKKTRVEPAHAPVYLPVNVQSPVNPPPIYQTAPVSVEKKPTFSATDFQQQQKEKHMKQRKLEKRSPAAPVARMSLPTGATIVMPQLTPSAFHGGFPPGLPMPSAFSAPVQSIHAPNQTNQDDDDEDADTEFLFSAVDVALKGTQEGTQAYAQQQVSQSAFHQHSSTFNIPSPAPMPSMSIKPAAAPMLGGNPFVSNESVSKILKTSGSDHALLGVARKKPAENIVSTPVPALSLNYNDMMPLVAATQQHPRFSQDYSFSLDSSWVQARPYGDWCKAFPQVIAIDCEMCVTEDPFTQVKDAYSLIRFSAVKGFDTSDVYIHT
jgi:hypothetical protein